jgi:transposase
MSMATKKKRGPGRPSRYAQEFQRDAVAMVLDEHRSIADVARSLGVNEGTLGNWVARECGERALGTELSRDERAELEALRSQVGELRMERDLLKRSMAFWVKESTR